MALDRTRACGDKGEGTGFCVVKALDSLWTALEGAARSLQAGAELRRLQRAGPALLAALVAAGRFVALRAAVVFRNTHPGFTAKMKKEHIITRLTLLRCICQACG